MSFVPSMGVAVVNWNQLNPRQADLAQATSFLDAARRRQPRTNEALSEVLVFWNKESSRLWEALVVGGHLLRDSFVVGGSTAQRALAPTLSSLLLAVDRAASLNRAYDNLAQAASIMTEILVNGWTAYGFAHATFWPHLVVSQVRTAAVADLIGAFDARLIYASTYSNQFKVWLTSVGSTETDRLLDAANVALPLEDAFPTPAEVKAAWAIKLRASALRMALEFHVQRLWDAIEGDDETEGEALRRAIRYVERKVRVLCGERSVLGVAPSAYNPIARQQLHPALAA